MHRSPAYSFARRFFLLALVASFVSATGRSWAQGEGPPPTPVRAERASLVGAQTREAVTGGLRAALDAVLAAREEGAVEAILAREGQAVKQGDPLLVIDQKRLQAQRTGVEATLAEAEAALVRTRAESQDASMDLESLEAAAKVGQSVSARELRRARTLAATSAAAVQAAEKRQESLEAELSLWDLRMADATLRAPFDGTVVEVHAEVGEWIQPGDSGVTLVSTGQLEVWLDVPERFMGEWQAGLPGELLVQVGAHDVIALEPRSVPRVDSRTRTFSIIASITGAAAAGLSPGMSASAWLPVGQPEPTLMVPKDALVYRPAGVAVMTVAGKDEGGASLNGTAMMVPIRILFETERQVAVAPGPLQEGAVVIVEGNERLFPGTPVAATITAPTAGPDVDDGKGGANGAGGDR